MSKTNIPLLFFIFILISPINAYTQDKLNESLTIKLNKLKQLASAEGISFRVTEGYRTKERQAELYAKGRTAPGRIVTYRKNSTHCKGIAFDIVILKGKGVSWKGEDYFRIGEIGESLGLVWGGRWKTLRDYCHFQLKE